MQNNFNYVQHLATTMLFDNKVLVVYDCHITLQTHEELLLFIPHKVGYKAR